MIIEEDKELMPDLSLALVSSQELDKREIWQKQRLGKFTASNIYKLMTYEDKNELSKGAITYIEDVCLEILTNGESKEEFISPAMQRGNDKELEAVAMFESLTGLNCFATGEEQEFIEVNEHFGGTPDGLFGKDGIIEVKCPKSKTHFFNLKNLKTVADLKKHYPEYYWQIQANLYATKRKTAFFISFDDRFVNQETHLFFLKVPKVTEDINKLKTKLKLAIDYKNNFIKQ